MNEALRETDSQQPARLQPQPSTKNEPQENLPAPQSSPIQSFWQQPNGQWFIAAFGQECLLSGLAGLGYLRELLAAQGRPVCLAVPESGPREVLPAVSLGKLKAAAHDLQARANAAWKRGDKVSYDRFVIERVALRKYQAECFAGGRKKFIETEATRDQNAVREAVRRAIGAIAKMAPDVAAHLRSQIRSSNGSWVYRGGLAWGCEGSTEGEIEAFLDAMPEGPLDVDAIRSRWRQTPCKPPVRRTPLEGCKTQLERLQVLRAIRAGVADAKSFKAKRGSYIYSEQFFEVKCDPQDEEIQEQRRAGDDREPDDFELDLPAR